MNSAIFIVGIMGLVFGFMFGVLAVVFAGVHNRYKRRRKILPRHRETFM